MIGRHGIAEQLFEVAAGQPHRGWWLFSDFSPFRVSAVLGELARERAHEPGVVPQVPAPQPARLVREPVGPFEPGALQPRWSLRHEAGMKVERSADADQHRRLEVRTHRRHPFLLLGDADADPHDVGLGSLISATIA